MKIINVVSVPFRGYVVVIKDTMFDNHVVLMFPSPFGVM